MSKIILITGVSSGLGKATANYLSTLGYSVYGTSRSIPENISFKKHVPLDITNPAQVNSLVKSIIEAEGRIDVLINNAGMGLGGPLEEFSEEEAQLQMNTNFFGVYRMCKAVIPYMCKQNGGLIINISSIGGLMGLPFQGFYSASKFAIEGFSESLRYELKAFNIPVVLINPGDFKTHFTQNRKTVEALTQSSKYFNIYNKTLQIIEKDENNGLDPQILAQKIGKIIAKRNPSTSYIVASFEQKLAVWLKYVLPKKLFFKIIGSHYGV